MRLAYRTSFRPLSPFELDMPVRHSILPIADARRGDTVTTASLLTGGHRDLEVVT